MLEIWSKVFSNLGKSGGKYVFSQVFHKGKKKQFVGMNVSWTVMWIDKEREVCIVVDGACVFVSGVYVVESTCVFMMYVMVVVVCVCVC